MIGLSNIKSRMAKYKEYRRLVNEIEALSAREAADVGIYKSDAHRIASEAVYGR